GPGEGLAREFEPLRPYLYIQGGHARQVAAASAQAGDKTQLDRVTPGREYDRNRRSRRFGRQRRRCASRGDDRDLLLNQIGRQRWQSVIVTFRPAILDRHVAALDITSFVEALAERGHHGCVPLRRPTIEEPKHRHRRLLRARRERPRGSRAAEQRDERAAFHSITSSASNWTELGTSRPIVLAICTLMTSSNLVNCTTGRSTGFAPLRI